MRVVLRTEQNERVRAAEPALLGQLLPEQRIDVIRRVAHMRRLFSENVDEKQNVFARLQTAPDSACSPQLTLTGENDVRVLAFIHSGRQCVACGAMQVGCENDTAKYAQCGACAGPYYCGRDCQRQHWPAHKPHCHRLSEEESLEARLAALCQCSLEFLTLSPSGETSNAPGSGFDCYMQALGTGRRVLMAMLDAQSQNIEFMSIDNELAQQVVSDDEWAALQPLANGPMAVILVPCIQPGTRNIRKHLVVPTFTNIHI